MAKTSSTRFPGVYTRESSKRKYNGKPDIVYYYCIKVEGRRVWTKCGWKSEGMTAAAAMQMRNAALMEGHGLAGKAPTLADEWEVFRSAHLPTLRNRYAPTSIFTRHILPAFGPYGIDDITSEMISAFIRKKLESGLSPASCVVILQELSSLYTQSAAAEKLRIQNPVKRVKPPRVDNKRLRYLTPAEADALLCALFVRSMRWHDLSALSLYTGARLGELLTLTSGCVDLDASRAEVNGKTGRRFLHLSAPAKAILSRRMEGRGMGDFLFPGKRQGCGSHSHRIFDTVLLELGINRPETPRAHRVVFHTLRHTFASWLAIRGVPLLVISQLLGHSSITMTQRYAHLCPDSRQSAVDLLAHFKPSYGFSR